MQDARCTRWLRYGRRSKTTPVGMGSDKDKDTDMAIRCITTVPSFETKQSKVRSSESTLPQRPTQLHDLPSTFPNFESALPRFCSLDHLMRAVQMSESGHSDMQSASGALLVATDYVSDRRVRGFRSLGRMGTVFVLDISLQIPRNGGCSVSTGSSHAFDL